jgi:hypothetical protein
MTSEYVAWNDALARRHLVERTGQPLYLYTDDSVLEELGAELGLPADFAPAHFVAAVVASLGASEPFRDWALKARAYQGTEPPPYLAVLCFLVFVAVERETTQFQYYPELNRHLGVAGGAAPEGFDVHVPLLFEAFNAWLEGPGADHGTPTARSHQHWAYIGWPLSQAVVRPIDRSLLAQLFHAVGLRPGEGLRASALRGKVLPRLRRAAESPSRTRLLELDTRDPDVLDDVLEHEYAGWNGSPVASGGLLRVLLRLCFYENDGAWLFRCALPRSLAGHEYRVGASVGTVPTFDLQVEPPDLWTLLGRGEVGQVVDGPTLYSRAARTRWLSVDRQVGGWAEVPGYRPESAHLALVPQGESPWFAGRDGVTQPQLGAIPFDVWLVPAGLALAAEPVVSAELLPALVGGLPLALQTRTYLHADHGAPAVQNVAEVKWMGRTVQAVAGQASLDLSTAVPGQQEVLADGRRIAFRTETHLQEPGCYDELVDWQEDLLKAAGRVRVPKRHGRIWLVGLEEGQLEERPSPVVKWLEHLGLEGGLLDVTELVRSAAFVTAYVVSVGDGALPAYVARVPERLRSSSSGARRKPVNQDSARQLVSKMLQGCAPDRIAGDREWKSCQSKILRVAHGRP